MKIKRMSRIVMPILLGLFFLQAGCGGKDPALRKLMRRLDRYPEYSIILEDMKVEGAFFKDYYHRYRLVWVESGPGSESKPRMRQRITGWYPVSKKLFDKYRSCLGMTLVAKTKDGRVVTTPQPPGYQYVGDPRYGRWRTDDKGNRFWEWFGQYMFFRTLFGGIGGVYGPIYYDDWNSYRTTIRRGAPYYGRRYADGTHRFGTQSKRTQKAHPTFFQRQQQRMAAKKSSFAQRVKSRTGRSRVSGFRSRAGGFGK